VAWTGLYHHQVERAAESFSGGQGRSPGLFPGAQKSHLGQVVSFIR